MYCSGQNKIQNTDTFNIALGLYIYFTRVKVKHPTRPTVLRTPLVVSSIASQPSHPCCPQVYFCKDTEFRPTRPTALLGSFLLLGFISSTFNKTLSKQTNKSDDKKKRIFIWILHQWKFLKRQQK